MMQVQTGSFIWGDTVRYTGTALFVINLPFSLYAIPLNVARNVCVSSFDIDLMTDLQQATFHHVYRVVQSGKPGGPQIKDVTTGYISY
jgi:hypothetical protein